VLAAALVLSPPLARAARRRLPLLAATGVVLALAAAPWLGRFRAADRTRALATEFTAHDTIAKTFARAWGWLDRHAGGGTVAVVSNPGNYFVYPAMGMRLARRAVYVNVNRLDLQRAADYPGCYPRIAPEPAAWVDNLERAGVRWVHLSHLDTLPFPPEDPWAASRPDRFALRYADAWNRIYEVLHPSGPS
jgi:hypothetical protein